MDEINNHKRDLFWIRAHCPMPIAHVHVWAMCVCSLQCDRTLYIRFLHTVSFGTWVQCNRMSGHSYSVFTAYVCTYSFIVFFFVHLRNKNRFDICRFNTSSTLHVYIERQQRKIIIIMYSIFIVQIFIGQRKQWKFKPMCIVRECGQANTHTHTWKQEAWRCASLVPLYSVSVCMCYRDFVNHLKSYTSYTPHEQINITYTLLFRSHTLYV